MLEIIKEILKEVIGVSYVSLETDFIKDLHLNSFDVVNIICALEIRFNIEIPTRDIWHINTVNDLIEYLTEVKKIAL